MFVKFGDVVDALKTSPQKWVSLSSTEAEYVALNKAANLIVGLKNGPAN